MGNILESTSVETRSDLINYENSFKERVEFFKREDLFHFTIFRKFQAFIGYIALVPIVTPSKFTGFVTTFVVFLSVCLAISFHRRIL